MASRDDCAEKPTKRQTPSSSNKRPRPFTKKSQPTSEKRKRINSKAITSITPVNLDTSSDDEYEMATARVEEDNENEFPVQRRNDAAPPPIVLSDLEKLLDRRFAVLATAEQIEVMGGRIKRNENDIQSIKHNIEKINERLQSGPATPPTKQTAIVAKSTLMRPGPGRELAYFLSRKSLRVWPIPGEDDTSMRTAYEDFAKSALKIPEAELKAIVVERIRRTRTSPRNAAYLEVSVTFTSQDDRDYVAGKAVNLAPLVDKEGQPQAGVRMDVPGFLMSTYNDLKSYAFQTRQSHGRGTKTHIKFDNGKFDLYLEVKLPLSENWLRILPEKARDLINAATSREINDLQTNLKKRQTLSERSYASSSSSVLSGGNTQPLPTPSIQWQPPPREQYPNLGFGSH